MLLFPLKPHLPSNKWRLIFIIVKNKIVFKTGSFYVVLAVLELSCVDQAGCKLRSSCLSPKCWDKRCVLPRLAFI